MKRLPGMLASFHARKSIWKGVYTPSFISFFGLYGRSWEKDHPSTFQLGTFPFISFYAFSDIGTVIYEKYHYGLSLSSFPSLSSRKDFRKNLVSFMLVKVFEQSSSHYRFNLFHPGWTTYDKEVYLPQRLEELSIVYFYRFLGFGDYLWKRDHIGVFFLFLDSLKMKTPSIIYCIGIDKNPWDSVILSILISLLCAP